MIYSSFPRVLRGWPFGYGCGLVVFAMCFTILAEEGADLEAVPITLPAPSFEGTPLDYFGPNLEKRSYKPRPEFMAPKGTSAVSSGKPATSGAKPSYGKLEYLTNQDKNYSISSVVEFPAGVQYVQLDLEAKHEIFGVVVWHYHRSERVYFDIVVQVSNDPDFTKEVTTVFSNDHDNSSGLGIGTDQEYIETHEGKLIKVDGAKGRYLRLYSNGSTTDDTNHYIEVEVLGRTL